MTGLRIGELFSGYGGLGAGVQSVLGGTVAWHSEIDPGACKILAHRYPNVPNLGDITAVDWASVEPVDVLTGGFPCQDVSSAGKRAGLNAETRSGLWAQMVRAIDELRPPLVVAENVRGLLSACALSELEPCPRCLGDESQPHRPVLRALGRVLGDLADLGYDARWGGLRASDIGAPHERFRVFVIAWPTAVTADDGLERTWQSRNRWHGPADGHHSATHPYQHEQEREPAQQSRGGTTARRRSDFWGPYADAIHRWERLTRPAPAATEIGSKGQPRLSPAFVEWMQGLPAGWVTDVPGLSRSQQIKALGNGVVPQQAAQALRLLLPDVARAAA